MRRERNRIGGDVQLLQQLAGVAMAEEAVGGKIVRRVHEVRLRGRRLARAGDAGLRIADDAVLHIDPSGGEQRLQRKDDRGGIAAGIRDQLRLGNRIAMQLRHAIDSRGVGLRRGMGELSSENL